MPTVLPRHLAVVAVVLAAHAGLLWLMNAGLESRPAPAPVAASDLVMAVQWLGPAAQPVPSPAPPSATVASATRAPARSATPPPQPAVNRPLAPAPTLPAAVAMATAPSSVASSDSREAPAPDAGETTGAASGAATQAADGASSPASASATPPASQIEWPSAAASYLNNPPPAYPPLSRRLGEQGKVVVRARIEVDGTASQAEIRTSSGYSRLDQTAIDTVLRWRYVPGTRNGMPEAMWFHIPIHFVLE